VKERDVRPNDGAELLVAQPDWLVAEQQRRHAQTEREAKDTLCGELADTLITSVHEVWLQELKGATTDAGVDAIDARWAPEVDRARREARRLVNQLTPEQARARIDREAQAAPPIWPNEHSGTMVAGRFEVPEGWGVQAFQFALDCTPEQAACVRRQFGGRRYARNWAVRTLKSDIDAYRATGAETDKPSFFGLRAR